MSEKARGVVVYGDWLSPVSAFSLEERGLLFTAVLQFASSRQHDPLPANLEIAFGFFQASFDRALGHYEAVSKVRSDAGRKGAASKRARKEANSANEAFADNRIEPNRIEPNSNSFIPPSLEEVSAFCFEMGISGFDAAGYVKKYTAIGWRDKNGNPIVDWRAHVGYCAGFIPPQKRKTVSAQQYAQREYGPGELDALGADLMAEARAAREEGKQ